MDFFYGREENVLTGSGQDIALTIAVRLTDHFRDQAVHVFHASTPQCRETAQIFFDSLESSEFFDTHKSLERAAYLRGYGNRPLHHYLPEDVQNALCVADASIIEHFANRYASKDDFPDMSKQWDAALAFTMEGEQCFMSSLRVLRPNGELIRSKVDEAALDVLGDEACDVFNMRF